MPTTRHAEPGLRIINIRLPVRLSNLLFFCKRFLQPVDNQVLTKLTDGRFFLAAFFFCQCCFTAFVTLASQARSLTCSSSSDAAEYLTLLGGGLPSGLSRRAPGK